LIESLTILNDLLNLLILCDLFNVTITFDLFNFLFLGIHFFSIFSIIFIFRSKDCKSRQESAVAHVRGARSAGSDVFSPGALWFQEGPLCPGDVPQGRLQ